ncbi:MAG: hypothetical protein ACREQI_16860 [Candidatus Binataceae bacterium]
MAQCDHCAKSVLTYVAIGDDGAEQRLCVHCDSPAQARLDWVTAEELTASGYYIGSPPAEKACSSGCGSCAVRKN